MPIAIALNRLLDPHTDESDNCQDLPSVSSFWCSDFLSPQSFSVAAVTFANGGDNIGIYVPIFASSTAQSLSIILLVFFALVGVWCYIAHRLVQLPAIAQILTRYGNQLVPFVLIGLGLLILLDSHTLENRGLAVLALTIVGLCSLHLFRNIGQSPEVALPDIEEN